MPSFILLIFFIFSCPPGSGDFCQPTLAAVDDTFTEGTLTASIANGTDSTLTYATMRHQIVVESGAWANAKRARSSSATENDED